MKDITTTCSKGNFKSKVSKHPSFKSDENQQTGDLDKVESFAFHQAFLHETSVVLYQKKINSSADGVFDTRHQIEKEAKTLAEVPVNSVTQELGCHATTGTAQRFWN